MSIENNPERVLTAMVTPFIETEHEDTLNVPGIERLADFLMQNGSDGLVLAGTTGESPTLTHQNQIRLFDVVRDVVGEDVLLVGGTGSNSTREAVELTRRATEQGAVDELLVVSPYYNRPSQYGIADYYRQVANVTDLPIILYNIPGRTGRLVELDTIRQLIDEGVIDGLKDATGNTEMAATLHDEYGGDFNIWSGDDGLNLEFARVGAIGAISVASHWDGVRMGEMFAAHFAGDNELADELQASLMPSIEFETTHFDATGVYRDTPNPVPAKVMMARILGQELIGEALSPMLVSPEDHEYLNDRAAELIRMIQTR